MKNKKGFTLVEVLAVIVVLAIIMIIAVPNVLGSLRASKDAISSIEKKAIEDGANQIVTEILNCEITNETCLVLGKNSGCSCSELENLIIDANKDITIDNLKNYGYFRDDTNHCRGKISLSVANNSYKVTVNTSGVECKK